jgi:hypothetical protein
LTISKSPLGDLGVRQKRRLLRHPPMRANK